ncbi:MAG: glycogen synthase GlgA [Lachnospiraceae bacterium]|nr:glycogen synthase GlgA [Lachnospiraceae bacterium]
MKNILFAASECAPFLKTGGLADVVGSLPKYLDKAYFDCRVVMPYYSCMDPKWRSLATFHSSFYMDIDGKDVYVGILECDYDGVHYYFIDNEEYLGREKPYLGMPTDLGRFAFFCKAVLSILPVVGFRPDIIHCHDWQTGFIPVYLNSFFQGNSFFHGIKSIMTIHNLKFQGIWDKPLFMKVSGLPEYYFSPDKMEFHRDANMLKGGMVYANALTTVSATYAEEIKTPYYGERLDGLLRARAHDLRGIVNGIDYDVFNPETDEMIPYHFSAEDPSNKKKVKEELQKRMGLSTEGDAMVIGIVSRLTDQKGFDLIACVMEEMLQDNVQFAVLGTGDQRYEDMFRYFADKYPGKVGAAIYYSEEVAHMIYAGSDAFLMPSAFEPCGLSQMMAMRYGSLPIVRETGGLKDTVQPYNEFDKSGTGFSFTNYNAHDMMNVVRYAEKVYFDRPDDWAQLVKQAMNADYSWKASALKYQEMYDWMCGY